MSEKISAMPVASALTGAELVPIVQSGDNKKTTAADIAALGGGGIIAQFEALPGVNWDFTDIEKASYTLAANTAFLLTGTANGDVGMLHLTQNGTGGWTVTINGTAITINDGPNETTLIGFVNTGALIEFDTNLAGGSCPPAVYSDIIFDDLVNMHLSAIRKYKNNVPGSNWLAGGRDTVNSIPALTDFVMLRKFVTGQGMFTYMGLTLTNVTHYDTVPNLDIAIGANDPANTTQVVKLEGTTQTALAAGLTNGGWYGIRRIGSALDYIQSVDGVTLVSVGNATFSSTAALYFAIIGYSDNVNALIDSPKYKLL